MKGDASSSDPATPHEKVVYNRSPPSAKAKALPSPASSHGTTSSGKSKGEDSFLILMVLDGLGIGNHDYYSLVNGGNSHSQLLKGMY